MDLRVASLFNQNFVNLSGGREAEVRAGTEPGTYVARCGDHEEQFVVRVGTTDMQLVGVTEVPARRLAKKVVGI